jgi:protein-tyrosine phosphatase
MTHPFDILNSSLGVSLIFTPCPGTKETSLIEAVETLANAGAKAIITLMPDIEMQKFNAQTLPDACQTTGLNWFHFPIEDDSVPDNEFQQVFADKKAEVLGMLKQENPVAIHCRGGSGRTGFMAAILLLELGLDWETVKSEVQSLRPKALTKADQNQYLKDTYQIGGE